MKKYLCMSSAAVVIGALRVKMVEFANSVGPDVSALNESSHLDKHCLPSFFNP